MNKPLSYGFHKIKLAYLFILFSINITVLFRPIDLLPDFVGYMFMLEGIKTLAVYRKEIGLLEPLARAMIIFTLARQVVDLFTGGLYPKIYFITVVVHCVYIYLHFRLLTGIIEIMEDNGLATKHMARSRNIIIVTRTFIVISEQYRSLLFSGNLLGPMVSILMVLMLILNLWRYIELAMSVWPAENKLRNIEKSTI